MNVYAYITMTYTCKIYTYICVTNTDLDDLDSNLGQTMIKACTKRYALGTQLLD